MRGMGSVALYALGAAAVAAGVGMNARAADHRAALDGETARARELDEFRQVREYCWQRQQHLAVEVLLGRVTLAAAAAELLELNRDRPDWLGALAANYPTDPDPRTRAARVLAVWTSSAAADDPSRHAEAEGRIAAELDAMTGRYE